MRLLLPLLVLLYGASASAQGAAERFDYEVHWGYSDVARVTLQRGCERDGYVPTSLSAKSLGVADQIHAMQIKLDSFVSPAGRSLEGRTFIEEEGVPRKYRTRFADGGGAFAQKTYRKKESTLRLSLRPGTHDLLSWFFALRSKSLTEGAAHAFYVWDGWKLTRVTARVGELERVWTPHGTYDARRVVLTRVRLHHATSQAYTPKSDVEDVGTVWLANDTQHTPVAMDFSARVGVAKLRLARTTSKSCR